MNSSRSALIDTFLSTHGWGGAKRSPLAGDASFRRYERVLHGARKAVLMDAPPGKEDIRPFMHASERLVACGLSAPRILASDPVSGLLLLEDLGDDLFARVLQSHPQKEEELYLAAADVLAELHARGPQASSAGFAQYDMPRFLQQVALFCEWFLAEVTSQEKAQALLPQYLDLWQKLLATLPPLEPTMVLYDFHAENLLWLPERKGVERVGLLDFQDAVMGSPAYDVVSFLEDARRDVSEQTVRKVLQHYLDRTRQPRDQFLEAYGLLGAQRNVRIVGTFVRLARRDGKHQYLSYLPRVWAHLQRDLAHPALAPLKRWMDEAVQPEWRGAIRMNPEKTRAAG